MKKTFPIWSDVLKLASLFMNIFFKPFSFWRSLIIFFKFYLFICLFIYLWKRGKEGRKRKNIHLSFLLFMHSLLVSCMCPDWNRTSDLGVSGGWSNHLSYPIRALDTYFFSLPCILVNMHTRLPSPVPICMLWRPHWVQALNRALGTQGISVSWVSIEWTYIEHPTILYIYKQAFENTKHKCFYVSLVPVKTQ